MTDTLNPTELVRKHADDSLIALFGDPPTTTCVRTPDHTIREGSVVYLAISVSNSGDTEIVGRNCGHCGFPDHTIVEHGEWVGIVRGVATPKPADEGVGEKLGLSETTVERLYRVQSSTVTAPA